MNPTEISGIASIVYSIFVVLIGYVIGRIFFKIEDRSLSIACLFVFAPAFLFRQALGQHLSAHLFTLIFFYLFFHTGIMLLAARGLFRLLNIPRAMGHLYLVNILIVSILGLRWFQTVLGAPDQAVETINTFIFFHLALCATLGVYMGSGNDRFIDSAFEMLKTPLVYAIGLGLPLAAIGIPLHFDILDGVDSLLNAMLPVGLLVVGIIWGRYIFFGQAKEYAAFLPGIVLCVIMKMIVSPAAALLISKIMGIHDATIQRAFILSSAAPTGVFAALLVSFYGKANEKRFTVFCIVLTTAVAFITIPLLRILLDRLYPLS
ncbi:MAG: AEC family transporter [Candidatus Omnitrophota bacterium]